MTGARFFAKQNARKRRVAASVFAARLGHRCDACGVRVGSLLEAVNWCKACNEAAAADRAVASGCACGGDGCDACEGSL